MKRMSIKDHVLLFKCSRCDNRPHQLWYFPTGCDRTMSDRWQALCYQHETDVSTDAEAICEIEPLLIAFARMTMTIAKISGSREKNL